MNAVPRDDADPDHLALSTYRLIIDENGGVLNIQPGLGGVGVRYQMLLPLVRLSERRSSTATR